MKKLIAALAVLAVAAVAQAELLATWSTGNGKVTAGENANVTIGNLTTLGGSVETTASSGNAIALNTLTADGAGFQFDVTCPGYYITDATITGTATGSKTGPKEMQWYVGSDPRGDAVIRTGTGNASIGALLGTINDGQIVSLRSVTSAGAVTATSTLGDGGSLVVKTGLRLDGDVNVATSVPEPATMSLLGLGALAMVLRRKLRK